MGYIPSFCTACYREGRTGDRFMRLVKSGQIANLEDYASPDTKEKGLKLIQSEIPKIPSEKVRQVVLKHLNEMENGMRDFRF